MAGVTETAATNSGDNISGAMAVALERPCSVAGRRRRGNRGGNSGEATTVSAATVDGGNRAGEVG